ncbi:MAG: ATP-binding protein [Pseudomonadota bacterium]
MKDLFHLRRYLPKSLFWRSFMIVFVPLIAVQIVVAIVFIDRLYNDVTRDKTRDLAREINSIFRPLSDDTILDLEALRNRAAPLALKIQERQPTAPKNDLEVFDISGRYAVDTLERALPGFHHVDFNSGSKQVFIFLERDQKLYSIEVFRPRISASNPHQLLVASFLSAIVFLTLAILFLRNQIRPINQLAYSAEEFGKGHKVAFSPSGATEVRKAGLAFSAMMRRIERQIEQRTAMLSGVSHDLRTPLTRMKLSLDLLDDANGREALLSDVNQMQHIIEEFLEFSRGDAGEQAQEVDLKRFAKSLMRDRKRLGDNLSLTFTGETDGKITIYAKKIALTRAITNLLSNAKRYSNAAIFSVDIGESFVRFIVEDDGPGIPKKQREKALRPFERLDAARNQNQTTGSGLGLSIALDIARNHGGSLLLERSTKLGGLRAVFQLPR